MIREDVTKDLLERPTPCFRLPRMTRKLGLGGSFGLVLDITGNVYDAWLQDDLAGQFKLSNPNIDMLRTGSNNKDTTG